MVANSERSSGIHCESPYGERYYHQVTDEFDPSWDLSGMVQQAQFTLNFSRSGELSQDAGLETGRCIFGKARAK